MKSVLAKFVVRSMVLACLIGMMVSGASPVRAEEDVFATLHQAMAAMKDNASKLGEPKADGSALFFGTTKMNDDSQFVDDLKAKFGCTATIFAKEGDGFVRISTNVMKDGKRAVGTPLDPKGAPIAAIKKGESFYGIVDILGSQYSTGYEPIKNGAGEIIGVYYVGFLVEAGTIEF